MRVLSAVILVLAGAQAARAAPVAPTVEAVLAANRAAVGPLPAAGACWPARR
jgi:hypothetical protein